MRSKPTFKWLGIVFCAASIIFFLAFHLIGSHVDQNGVLHEPFALIPMGWISLAVGAGSLVTSAILQ